MPRPNREESAAIAKRDQKIWQMYLKNYPQTYIAAYFGLNRSRVSQIIKRQRIKINEQN